MSADAFAAAAHAAVIEAIKASGVVVRVYPADFQTILQRAPGALVVHATHGLFSTTYQYLVSSKGLAFYTESRESLPLPPEVEAMRAESIWVPD